MTNVKGQSITDQFHHLVGEQLLIRATVSRSELRSPHEHCMLDIVSLCPDLYADSSVQRAWGFVHLTWYCGYEEKKGDMQSSPLHLNSLFIEEDVTGMESHKRARRRVVEAVGHWEGNITGDGPRPTEEWLEPKPFVGVASIGIRPNVRSVTIRDDGRSLLMYYGYLLGVLENYVAQLKTLSDRVDPDLEARYLLLDHLLYRWRSFIRQCQGKQMELLFA